MSYWIHPEAEGELGDAAVYYAEHASLAVAEAFLAEFERMSNALVEDQNRGSRDDFDLKVPHFDHFPYTIIFDENPVLAPQIYAVAHQRRKLGY